MSAIQMKGQTLVGGVPCWAVRAAGCGGPLVGPRRAPTRRGLKGQRIAEGIIWHLSDLLKGIPRGRVFHGKLNPVGQRAKVILKLGQKRDAVPEKPGGVPW